ncbi:MAG TPA: hypothetical protein VLB68_11990 [Pyrinomonadaceae bacterium]|nr:hypothetical protein [Pyrinomonadaceae bacterium]
MPIRYFIYSAIVEALALTPVAVAGIGHAGPNGGLLALISFFLNLPGIFVVGSLSDYWDFPWSKFVVAVFVVQTAGLWLIGLLVARLRAA